MTIDVFQNFSGIGGVRIFIMGDSIPHFRELVQRGSNLWPDAPPEIKELADLITIGKIQQDYRSQDTSRKEK